MSKRALLRAVEQGDLATVDTLVKGDAQRVALWANALNKDGEMPLSMALQRDRQDIALLLIPHTNLKVKDNQGHGPLYYAFLASLQRQGNRNTNRFASIEAMLPRSGLIERNKLLSLAARVGDVELIRLVLPVSNPKTKYGGGSTPLILAAESGHLDCVKLLAPLSDLDARSCKLCAWQYAGERGHWDCMDELLARQCADPHFNKAELMVALFMAEEGKLPQVVAQIERWGLEEALRATSRAPASTLAKTTKAKHAKTAPMPCAISSEGPSRIPVSTGSTSPSGVAKESAVESEPKPGKSRRPAHNPSESSPGVVPGAPATPASEESSRALRPRRRRL